MSYVIHWFRNDLRLKDNQALYEASKSGYPILLVYIYDEDSLYTQADAHRVWLYHSLIELKASLENLNLSLVIKKGSPKKIFHEIIKEAKPYAIYYNDVYEHHDLKNAQDLRYLCEEHGTLIQHFHGNLIAHPDAIKNSNGTFINHFTPFWNAINHKYSPRALYPLPKIERFSSSVSSLDIEDLNLPSSYHWNEHIKKHWKVNETHAQKKLNHFLKTKVNHYIEHRQYLGKPCSSELSAYLHFGEIGPYQIIDACNAHINRSKIKGIERQLEAFIKDLALREFAYYLLYHQYEMKKNPLEHEETPFHWTENTYYFNAWKKGITGFPIVDAAMRQLLEMGWMPTQARLLTASFLVKDLKIHREEGEHWFFKNLFDADIANNLFNWQFSAQCGNRFEPFLKTYHVEQQSKKTDPDGEYIKTWIPELKKLPSKYIHAPHKAPAAVLKKAKIILGETYPMPIIDLNESAKKTLKQLQEKAKQKKKIKH
ncbi:MAG: DNA photolyase family protein [Simkaniaceae bacterium]|nr:DNA photolyase family protein [Simkaniaceae bacterium]